MMQVVQTETGPGWLRKRAIWWDIIFVLVLPSVCFVLDPILFGSGVLPRPLANEAFQFATYVIAVIVVASFFALKLRMLEGVTQSMATGILLMGIIAAYAIGLALVLVAGMGIVASAFLVVLGYWAALALLALSLLGLAPFVTAIRLQHQFLAEPARWTKLMWLGFLLVLCLALAIGYVVHLQKSALLDRLQVANSEKMPVLLRETLESALCREACRWQIVSMYKNGVLNLPEVQFWTIVLNASGEDERHFDESADVD